MASQIAMDGTSLDWSCTHKQPHLPPKSPSFPNNMASALLDNGLNNIFSSLSDFPQHRRILSATLPSSSSTHFSCIDDDLLLADANLEIVPKRKPHHRRSSSDSAAFLDISVDYFRSGSANCIAEEDGFDCGSVVSVHSRGSQDFDKLDEEQLMAMFKDIEPFQKQEEKKKTTTMPCSESKRAPAAVESPSDQDSVNEEKVTMVEYSKGEGEAQSSVHIDDCMNPQVIKGEQTSTTLNEMTLDPKRVKRILANRLSAQRSRVRKLQYISELERSINTLQAELSALSPQVAYLDHQRILLNVDNSALKQRMAALAQDQLFKDAHNEALKKEVERLRQIYLHGHRDADKLNSIQRGDSEEAMKHAQENENGSVKSGSHPRSFIPMAVENGRGLEGRMLSSSGSSDIFV